MKYHVRKEHASWVVRGECGHFYAARRTHPEALTWADSLATNRARRRTASDLYRIRAAIHRIENQ